LALVDLPGKGMQWVRRGSKVGHSVIDEIEDGSVVVKDAKGTYSITAQRKDKPSLIKSGTSLKPKTAAKKTTTGTISPEKSKVSISPPLPGDELQGAQLLEMLLKELNQMKTDSAKQQDESEKRPEDSEIDDFIKELESMRVDSAEQKKLDDLPKQLEKSITDSNQPKAGTSDSNQPNAAQDARVLDPRGKRALPRTRR